MSQDLGSSSSPDYWGVRYQDMIYRKPDVSLELYLGPVPCRDPDTFRKRPRLRDRSTISLKILIEERQSSSEVTASVQELYIGSQ